MQVVDLLDRAKNHTGSDIATAKQLRGKVSAVRMSQWRHGTVPCPTDVQDQLMLVARLTDAEIAAHVIERASQPGKRRSNASTLASFVAAFAGYIAIALAPHAAQPSPHASASSTTMYIMSTRMRTMKT